MSAQADLFIDETPATEWNRKVTGRALDELFSLARQYRSSEAYKALLDFVARFRFYAPFNAMLLHVQRPGATYVAPPSRWRDRYQRRIKTGASPLVILQPMGPVMFVFDVADTDAEEGAPALPPEVVRPFPAWGKMVFDELPLTIENARRDGVKVCDQQAALQSAGLIRIAGPGQQLLVTTRLRPRLEQAHVPLRYELLVNEDFSREEKYATLVHELAHLYCGHLGTPNERWWPDRRGLPHDVCEFEAESVSYLVCQRLGIESSSERYLADYVRPGVETPPISLECVMKAAGLIEQMGRERLPLRKGDNR
jgi:hypothetical protein